MQTTLNSNEYQAGILADELKILDNLIPLRNASHADVVEYRVEVPMRYAECYAIMADGSEARFVDARTFLGWSSHDARRSLLFRNDDVTLEVEVDNGAFERQCSTVRSINVQAALRQGASSLKKFIGIDGDLLTLPAT